MTLEWRDDFWMTGEIRTEVKMTSGWWNGMIKDKKNMIKDQNKKIKYIKNKIKKKRGWQKCCGQLFPQQHKWD